MDTTERHRSGFVNIIGNPNVGKSTLMNALIGQKLSIITSKAQTTRNRIHGIINADHYQVIFSDTPGILSPNYKLQENMRKTALGAFADADILLYITDVFEAVEPDPAVASKIQRARVPVILVMNKIDLSSQEKLESLQSAWMAVFPKATFIPVSAKENFNTGNLFSLILQHLPESPPFYPKDMLTDKSERFFAAEILREKILLNYDKEIPYAVEIEIEEFIEEGNLNRIRAIIYAERDSQKGILIGARGAALKKTGTMSRLEMEQFFGKKVFLEIVVKLKKDWRNNEQSLRKFGYH
jgi:GTP-binding protein Era